MTGTEQWDSTEVEVCVDCLHTVANGLPDHLDPDRAQAITTGLAGWAADGWRIEPGHSDNPHFSWGRCEVCGDGRGGDRTQAWALRPPTSSTRQEGPIMRDTLIHPPTGAAYWLAGDHALMAAPLDPDTGQPIWADAGPADPMSTGAPDTVLAIQDTLITRATHTAAVAPDRVGDPTGAHLGYLVRDRAGTDTARYDRLDLAIAAATAGGGSIHAWGQVGHGPIGWQQITWTPPATRTTAVPAQLGAATPVTRPDTSTTGRGAGL